MGSARARRSRHTAITESLLAQRWSEQLGVEARPADTFYDLGGSSLQVVDMLERLRNDWAVSLAPADLVEHPTLREFATYIASIHSSRFRSRATTTVQLQQGDPPSTEPLFAIAGAGASSLSFMRLADAIEPHIPVYSLQGRGVETRGWPDWTVRAAVRRQLREIRRIQPSGTYHLTGHSAGAIIALECARVLRDSGDRVAPIVLIDPQIPPRSPAAEQPVDPSGSPVGTTDTDSPSPSLGHRLRSHGRVLVCGLVQFDVQTQQSVTWEHGKRAQNRHRLEAFDHPVTVVLSQEYADQCSRWPLITGDGTQITSIGRRHNDVLRENVSAMLCADLIFDTTFSTNPIDTAQQLNSPDSASPLPSTEN